MTTPPQFPRILQHPGTVSFERYRWTLGTGSGIFRLLVPQNMDLYEYLETWTRETGLRSGGFQLLFGGISELSVMTGKPDESSKRVATFDGPHQIACPAEVLGGKGLIGHSPGGPVIHTHAIFMDAFGNARGCHLLRGHCVPDARGLAVAFFALAAVRFRVRQDPETTFDLFFPEASD